MARSTKTSVSFTPKEIKRFYDDFLKALGRLSPDIIDFFLLYVVNGVDKEEAWEMTHDIPEGTGKNPVLNRRRKIKKDCNDACQKTSFRVALEKWTTYNCADALDYREYVLGRAKAIADAEIGKTTYRHPKSGKPIARNPQQLGRNESIAATQVTSNRGRMTYRLESKIAALNIIKDIVGLNAAQEVKHSYAEGQEPKTRVKFVFGKRKESDDD